MKPVNNVISTLALEQFVVMSLLLMSLLYTLVALIIEILANACCSWIQLVESNKEDLL